MLFRSLQVSLELLAAFRLFGEKQERAACPAQKSTKGTSLGWNMLGRIG